jgi:tetratricopeptide (TPR) repeat protein
MNEPPRSGSSASELHSILIHGTGASDAAVVRRALGLPAGSEDKLFARALVRAIAEANLPQLPIAAEPDSASPHTVVQASEELPEPVTGTRAFLVRTAAVGPDVRTLLLIVRAGSLFQRRESVLRIGELLQRGAPLTAELRRQALDTLLRLQHTELAHEIGVVLARLPGGEGRAARAEQRARSDRATQVEAKITAYWDGEEGDEPIASLNGEERAQLLARLRGLPDLLVRHVAALLEDSNGTAADVKLRTLLGSLEHSGDPRLFPALRALLLSADVQALEPVLRALASIDDPRVAPLLRDAYERAAPTRERLQLAAALGRHGDNRGLGYARETLAGGDPGLLLAALEALAELGSGEDVQRVSELLENADETLVRVAVATLGRIGDGRALVPLTAVRARAQRSALRAHVEDAELSIRARIELLGEEVPSQLATTVAWDTSKMVARARTKDPTLVRVRARLYHLFAYLWLVVGASLRAIARFEAAAALRPEWLAPVLALALLYVRGGQTPQALAAFRRAVDIDRYALEGDGHAITALAQTFLRRAEAMEQEGRYDIARGLLEEVLSFDLRKAAAEVRFALQERLELSVAREREWKA